RQEVEVPQDEAEHEESVPTPSNDPQASGEDSMKLTDLMVLCTKLQTQVLDLQKANDAQAKEIAALKKRIQRLERRKISRPTDASKQGRSIEDIDANVDVSLVDETQERQDDDLIFDTGVLDDVEMHVEAKVDGKDKQSTKKLDSTAGEAVTTVGDDSVEPSEFRVPQEIKPSSSKDKGKEEQKLARKQEEEANIALIESWKIHKLKENKEKKEKGRNETTKGNRKKMLGRKRVGKEQQKESSKKLKVEEEKESEEVEEEDKVNLKKLLVIKKDEYIAIDAIPLATK
ncbi:hypothetical protein Tco_0636004, partial [Tanacetum coccineum]